MTVLAYKNNGKLILRRIVYSALKVESWALESLYTVHGKELSNWYVNILSCYYFMYISFTVL
jgi:hypothetical protein